MAATQKHLTGWHVLAMLVAFFGVIIGVNLTMAYFANSTWSGLVVANGFVASQSFDKDLAKSRAQAALGWTVDLKHDANSISLSLTDKDGTPIDGLTITGDLERTVTDAEDQALTFTNLGGGIYSAPATLAPGLWEVELDARGNAAISDYRKIIRFTVKG
jgi:nitrogen fixation protein FixH